MSLLTSRTSIREYTNEPITEQQIETVLRAAMQAPSANNQQPWEFIVIDDRDLLNHLSKASKGAWMLEQAPLDIVVVMKDGGRSPLMKAQDCAAATQNILLAATEQNLGAVWIGVYPLEDRMNYVNEALSIHDGTAFCQIAIGHPKQPKDVTLRYDSSRVHRNKME